MGCAAARHPIISLVFNVFPVTERLREITWKATSGHWFLRRTLLWKTHKERGFYKNWRLNGPLSCLNEPDRLLKWLWTFDIRGSCSVCCIWFCHLKRRPGMLSIGPCRGCPWLDSSAEFWIGSATWSVSVFTYVKPNNHNSCKLWIYVCWHTSTWGILSVTPCAANKAERHRNWRTMVPWNLEPWNMEPGLVNVQY